MACETVWQSKDYCGSVTDAIVPISTSLKNNCFVFPDMCILVASEKGVHGLGPVWLAVKAEPRQLYASRRRSGRVYERDATSLRQR
jgi:hypothetical protein